MKIPLIRESNGHPSLCDENDEHKVLGNLVRIIQYVVPSRWRNHNNIIKPKYHSILI